jgi:hypothetical protein
MANRQTQKLTVIVPKEVLRRARRSTKAGITPTVVKGLQILAAHDAYEGLRKLRGKVKFSMTWQELRGDE